MVVYMDKDRREIVTEEVARRRMADSINTQEMFNYIFDYRGIEEIMEHLDTDYLCEIRNAMVKDWFFDDFEEYEIIESE